jgi:hypothetical protein
VGLVAVAALVSFGLGSASGTDFTVQISKGCDGPAYVGDPYECHSHLTNQDINGNNYIVHSLVDRVASSGGTVTENLFALHVPLVFVNDLNATPVSCTNGAGTGTVADPFIPTSTTVCTLPGDLTKAGRGGRINVGDDFQGDYGVYTVQPGDFTAGGLTDQIEYDVSNACNVVATNCNTATVNPETASGSTDVIKRLSKATTTILSGANAVTIVAAGTTVHDSGTVSEDTANENPPPISPGPVPTGNVTIKFFQGGTCDGTLLDTGTAALDGSGNFNATGMPEAPTTPGMYSFQATYNGDGTYAASPASGCEPLQVVDANIQITPATATNPTGANHVLTITVNALGGTLDAGPHTATASIVSGPGSFVGSPTCTYTGGAATASCTVTITSATVGTTVVSATSNIPVNGVSITRTTGTAANTAAGGSGNASKNWVDANIQITPATATNPLGTNHVLTITVNALGGTIDAGPHTATASIVSGPGSFVGSPTCTYTGGGATASCTVTITSNVVGTTVVSATSNIPVNGVVITRTTGTAVNTASGGSGNASKNWVDANIQITPATATNPIGTNHVLTITVNALGGTLDAGPHTATASIVSGPGSFVGSPTCTYTGGAATASCTVTITSSVAGTTVISATSNIPVNGVSITRTTGTAVNTASGGSDNAQKLWVQPDANIQITPATATNPVNTDHVLTCHINTSPDSVTYSNAPDGTVCTVTIISGPGTPVSQTCTTTGGTGSCQVTITSATVGTSVVQASTTVVVNSVTLNRMTGDAHVGDGANAHKNWVDANINITPGTANNPIGANHVLTITVNALGGTIDAGPHTATASIVSGPGSFVGSPSCTYTGGGATASCTVTITSSTPGTTVVSATSNIPVNGVTITRTTGTAVNTASGGSGNASKNWADDTIVTHVRDANNADITGQTVTPGTVVHDEADVTKAAGTPAAVPAPTGTVNFTLFDNGTCDGNVVATDSNEPLNGSGVANSATFTTTAGTFSYLAHYNGDANYPAHDASCEPFTVQGNFGPALTPGFWKNHQAATTALLPITLGNYNVNTFAKALAIFNAMKCSAPIDCLAGHELAAKLDLAGGSNPSILPVIAQADALLIAVNYNGPGNYTPPTAAQKSLALQLEVLIDAYTNQ